jgi:hypothetical protein
VLWHRAQRCSPGLAHPSLVHVGLESYARSYNNCFSRLHGGAIEASDGGGGEHQAVGGLREK